MTSNEKTNPRLPISGFHIYQWQLKDFIVLLVNGLLLIFLMICSGKLIFEMLLESPGTSKDELWIAMILAGLAYAFSISFAKGSVQVFEKSGEITNITQILRFYSLVYFFGLSTIYWIIILKLSERDYAFFPRYFQYVLILILCYVCVRYFASIPKKQDIMIMAALIYITTFIHVSSIIFQYIFLGANDFKYFFLDIAVLIGMAVAATFTLFGRWKAQSG